MATFTSTLPIALLELLNKKAKELKMPKNKLIEKALQIYLIELNKAEYISSYKQMGADTDLLKLAEEGIGDYLRKLNTTEK